MLDCLKVPITIPKIIYTSDLETYLTKKEQGGRENHSEHFLLNAY